MNLFIALGIALAGLIAGLIISAMIHITIREYGILLIDNSNPEKDIYRLELDNLDHLSKKKKIVLKISRMTNISQK